MKNKTDRKTKIAPDAVQLSPLRVNRSECGGWLVMTRRDETPGTLNNFSVAECQHEADARLFAAAPDMLKALLLLFENCEVVHKHWGEGCNLKEANAAIASAHAAIAKATEAWGAI